MRSLLKTALLNAALANMAILASDLAPYSDQQEVRHYRRGKRLQTPEEKQAALAKAEAKRRRKGHKRYRDYSRCQLFNMECKAA